METPAKTVLVIEDENNRIGIPPQFFSAAGYKLEVSGKAAEGIAKCRALKPGVVVLDMLMPDMPGDETVRELSGHPDTRDIPVIITLPPGFYPSGITGLKKMGKQVEVIRKPVCLFELKDIISSFSGPDPDR